MWLGLVALGLGAALLAALWRQSRALREQRQAAERGQFTLKAVQDTLDHTSAQLAMITVERDSAREALQRLTDESTTSVLALRERVRDLEWDRTTLVQERDDAVRQAEVAAERLHSLRAQSQAVAATGDTHRVVMDRAHAALLLVGDGVDSAAATVRSLVPASAQIDQFVDLVTRLAKQTNLLALNASMEASRAGEAGVGFSVVAEEIRRLAVESSNAAQRISTTVQSVRRDIEAAAQAMETTRDGIADRGALARDATRGLSSLLDGLSRLADHGGEATLHDPRRLGREGVEVAPGVPMGKHEVLPQVRQHGLSSEASTEVRGATLQDALDMS